MRKVLISPSILNVDAKDLEKKISEINDFADLLHFDVMDGKFVPAKSFDHHILKEIAPHHTIKNDVHLMVEHPEKMIADYADAGANIITVHYEAFDDKDSLISCLKDIRNHGIKAGLSIKPNTKVEVLDEYLKYIDLILIMSVEPGLGGQPFMPESLKKINWLRNAIDSKHYDILIEVDGGINEETAKLAKEAGVDVLVSGSFIFGHEKSAERIEKLR